MPNRVVVKPHNELIAIRKDRKHARPYHMGTVGLKNVTVLADGISGEWLYEFEEVRELGHEVLSKLTELVYEPGTGFGTIEVYDDGEEYSDGVEEIVMFVPVTGNTYRAAYICGTEFYVG